MGWSRFPLGEAYAFRRSSLETIDDNSYRIRPGDYHSDRPHLMQAYDASVGQIPLAWVRSADYWNDSAAWLMRKHPSVWIAERDNRLAAYLIAPEKSQDSPTPVECVYFPGDEASALALLRHFLSDLDEGASVVVRLPQSHPWTNVGERVDSPSGEMWQCLNRTRLLGRLESELTRRLPQSFRSTQPFTLGIAGGAEPVTRVKIEGGRVNVLPPTSGQITVDAVQYLSDADFVRMVLTGADDAWSPWLGQLFPPQAPFVWPMDHF